MSVGSRIKELREMRNISRSKLAESLGVTVGAISNYENGVSSPKEPILFNIMEVLHCDANYIFQDAMKFSVYKNESTPEEFEKIIKKYRTLDLYGKEVVEFILNKEYDRCTKDVSLSDSDDINHEICESVDEMIEEIGSSTPEKIMG